MLIAPNRSEEIVLPQIDLSMSEKYAWWALYTRHQHERTVADTLSSKGFEVFLPLYESTRRWKDRTKLLLQPLFPGYLFVREEISRRLQVVTTPGVHMILSRAGKFAVIPDTEIRAIRKTLKGSDQVEPHPFLLCGERVRVKAGPLQGIEGILTRKKSMFRLILSVDMLAQSVAVEVDAADLEPTQGLSASSLRYV